MGKETSVDLEDSVFDEDSSAEQAEIQYRKSQRMLLDNMVREEEEYSSDSSGGHNKGHRGSEDNYSTAGLDMEFAPVLMALPQSAEAHHEEEHEDDDDEEDE